MKKRKIRVFNILSKKKIIIITLFFSFLIPYTILSIPDAIPYLIVNKTLEPTNVTCQNVTVTLNVSGSGEALVKHFPIDVMLIIDRSGSMSGTKIADAKTAAQTFVNFLTDTDRGGLVSYSTSASLDQGLKYMDDGNKSSLNTTINGLSASGNTNIYDAIDTASTELINFGRGPPVPLIEILLTDGLPNTGNLSIVPKANESANAGIIIYTIGLGAGANETLLQEIANITDGKYYFAPNSSVLADIYSEIAQELLNVTITNVTVKDVLPDYVDLINTPLGCTYVNRTITCDLGELDINETKIISFNVSVNKLGNNRVNVYPDSGVNYTDIEGNITFIEFPERNVTVHAHPNATEVCNDTVDNDCDGLIDCDDPDCSGDPACLVCVKEDGIYVINETLHVDGINILDYRNNSYAFIGESIEFYIVVRDVDGWENIGFAIVYVDGEPEVICNPLDPQPEEGTWNETDLLPCGFNNETDKGFHCLYTVEPDKGLNSTLIIIATDTDDEVIGTYDESWDFNPGIILNITTSDSQPIHFEPGFPGDNVSSENHIIAENLAEGGVNLWMYLAGTDLYDITGAAKCPRSNRIDIEDWMYFRGWTINITGNWTQMSEYDDNDGCSLFETCYGGLPLPGSAPDGNILMNQAVLEVEFKLEYPVPCIGNFTEGTIYLFGKVI